MFSEVLLVQLIIVLLTALFYKVYDTSNLLIKSILFLIASSAYLLILDGDIFVSFLLIIDLGVFFIFFAFLIHLTSFLLSKSYVNSTASSLVQVLPPVILLIVAYVFYNSNYIYQAGVDYVWFFYITHSDFYALLSNIFQSDMNLLREVYFLSNFFEFFLLSVAIYFAILTIQLFINLLNIACTDSKPLVNLSNKNSSVFFFKRQDFNKQSTAKASSRVWKNSCGKGVDY